MRRRGGIGQVVLEVTAFLTIVLVVSLFVEVVARQTTRADGRRVRGSDEAWWEVRLARGRVIALWVGPDQTLAQFSKDLIEQEAGTSWSIGAELMEHDRSWVGRANTPGRLSEWKVGRDQIRARRSQRAEMLRSEYADVLQPGPWRRVVRAQRLGWEDPLAEMWAFPVQTLVGGRETSPAPAARSRWQVSLLGPTAVGWMAVVGIGWTRRVRRLRLERTGACVGFGYDLRGSVGGPGRCPECGRVAGV